VARSLPGAELTQSEGNLVNNNPYPPVFCRNIDSKILKVLCFSTLLQVLILSNLKIAPKVCKMRFFCRYGAQKAEARRKPPEIRNASEVPALS
jgi:hypothetical protein